MYLRLAILIFCAFPILAQENAAQQTDDDKSGRILTRPATVTDDHSGTARVRPRRIITRPATVEIPSYTTENGIKVQADTQSIWISANQLNLFATGKDDFACSLIIGQFSGNNNVSSSASSLVCPLEQGEAYLSGISAILQKYLKWSKIAEDEVEGRFSKNIPIPESDLTENGGKFFAAEFNYGLEHYAMPGLCKIFYQAAHNKEKSLFITNISSAESILASTPLFPEMKQLMQEEITKQRAEAARLDQLFQ